MQHPEVTSSRNKWPLVLGILLLLSLAGNVYQFFHIREVVVLQEKTEQEKDTLEIRKQELEEQFTEAIDELAAYRGRSEALDSLLAEANLKLEEQRRQISRLIDENQDYQVLQQRYDELRRTKEEYLLRIIALEEENKRLKFEVNELSVQLDQKSDEARTLSQKVDIASRLQVSSMSVAAFTVKGKEGNEKPTDKARRTDRLNIRFTVEENKVAPPGERTAYVRIFNPEGFVMADAGQIKKFPTAKGEELPYSRSIMVDFNGERISRTVAWDQDVFPPGTYKVEIYLDGYLVSSEQITLN
jgi:hypothetical protein